jgi:TatD DNase family protein
MIDTHAHLNFSDFDNKVGKIISLAEKSLVEKIVCVSSSVSDSKKAIALSKKYPKTIYPAVGIHPQKTDPENKSKLTEQIKIIQELAEKNNVVAIGESGLDYSPAPPPEKNRSKKDQWYLFEQQIKLAIKLNLPLIVHTRKAFKDTVSILEKYPEVKGVVHCYSAGKGAVEKVLDLGFLFGTDGNLTYDQGLQNVFSQIPLNKIILETDSPFLTPEPKRGEINQPAFLSFTAKKLAEIKNVSLGEVDRVTTRSAKRLFRL